MAREFLLLGFAWIGGIFPAVADAQIWSVPLKVDNKPGHRATSLAFDPKGQWFATAGNHYDPHTKSFGAEILVWDVAAPVVKKTLRGGSSCCYGFRAHCLVVSADGKTLATSGWRRKPDKTRENFIEVWDLPDEKIRTAWLSHDELIGCLALSPDGKTLASGTMMDGRVTLWDFPSGKERLRLQAGEQVYAVLFSPDGKDLATGSVGNATLWDPRSGKKRIDLPAQVPTSALNALAFSSDGKLAGGELTDEGIREHIPVWKPKTKPAKSFKKSLLLGHEDDRYILTVAFSPDGKLLASGGHDKTVKIWDVTTAKEITTLTGHAGFVLEVAFSPDGKHLASLGSDAVKVWSVAETLKGKLR